MYVYAVTSIVLLVDLHQVWALYERSRKMLLFLVLITALEIVAIVILMVFTILKAECTYPRVIMEQGPSNSQPINSIKYSFHPNRLLFHWRYPYESCPLDSCPYSGTYTLYPCSAKIMAHAEVFG